MNFLSSIKGDWNTKAEWIDVKNTQNGPVLLRERKTWGKRLIYQILSFATLGFWKKKHGIDRVIKEMQKIAENQNLPVIPYELEVECLVKLQSSIHSKILQDKLAKVDKLAQKTLFKTSKKLIQELLNPTLEEKKRVETIHELSKNLMYLQRKHLKEIEKIQWSHNPSEEEKSFLLQCSKKISGNPSYYKEFPFLTKKAADLGNAEACFKTAQELYCTHFESIEREKDCLSYFLKASSAGHSGAIDFLKISALSWRSEALYTLSTFFSKASEHQDLEVSFNYLCLAVREGNPTAFEELEKRETGPEEMQLKRNLILGLCYYKAKTFEKNIQKATHYLKKISKEELSKLSIMRSHEGYALQDLVNIARLLEQGESLKGEKAQEHLNVCLADCKKLENPWLRMAGYALCEEASIEKKAPWKMTLDKTSFTLKFEEKEILLDLSKEVQREQEGAWKTPEINTIDLSQKTGLTEENLRRFLKSLETGQIEGVEGAIEHVLIAEELQIPPLQIASYLLENAIADLDSNLEEDLESAKALTECVKSVQFPESVVNHLGMYWARVFNLSKNGAERHEIIITLQHLHPEMLKLEGNLLDEEMTQIMNIKGLKDLTLSGYLGEKGLIEIKRAEMLKELQLENCEKITDEVLHSIAGVKNLESLKIYNCPFDTQEGLKILSSLEKLTDLRLSGALHLEGIGELKKLTKLYLEGPSVTDTVVREICQSEFPALLELALWNSAASEKAIQSLAFVKPELHIR